MMECVLDRRSRESLNLTVWRYGGYIELSKVLIALRY
jgi:hypothetical protein